MIHEPRREKEFEFSGLESRAPNFRGTNPGFFSLFLFQISCATTHYFHGITPRLQADQRIGWLVNRSVLEVFIDKTTVWVGSPLVGLSFIS